MMIEKSILHLDLDTFFVSVERLQDSRLRELCPEAIVIRGNAGTYTKYSKLVTDIIKLSAL